MIVMVILLCRHCTELPALPFIMEPCFHAPLLQNAYTLREAGIFSYIGMHSQKRARTKVQWLMYCYASCAITTDQNGLLQSHEVDSHFRSLYKSHTHGLHNHMDYCACTNAYINTCNNAHNIAQIILNTTIDMSFNQLCSTLRHMADAPPPLIFPY